MNAPQDEDVARTPGLSWPPLPPWYGASLAELAGARSTLPHALLVHGPAGIGKHALALHLAQALLCEQPAATGTACGACPGCRLAEAGQHPDLMRVELTRLDEESDEPVVVDTIAVDRVRTLIEFTQLTSHRHRAKVAVIAPADRMNAAAANALLKTLEEPPIGTFLMLVSSAPGRLPPTIASRCRRVRLAAPTAADACAWLRTQSVRDAEVLLAQAAGAPLAALALADPAAQEQRRRWLTALSRPGELPIVQLAAQLDSGPREDRRRRLGAVVEWLLAWTHDLARAHFGGAPSRNPDFAAALAALGPRVARIPLFRYHRTLLEQRALAVHPLQPRLVAEALLCDYRSLFNGCTL
jgi:DNA polymerase-3 subunit delta'